MEGNYKNYKEVWKNRPIRMSDILWNKVKEESKERKVRASEFVRDLIEKDLEDK